MIYSKYGYRRLVKLLLDFTGRDIYDLVISSKLLLWLRHAVPSKNKSIANIHASASSTMLMETSCSSSPSEFMHIQKNQRNQNKPDSLLSIRKTDNTVGMLINSGSEKSTLGEKNGIHGPDLVMTFTEGHKIGMMFQKVMIDFYVKNNP